MLVRHKVSAMLLNSTSPRICFVSVKGARLSAGVKCDILNNAFNFDLTMTMPWVDL